jgi:putative oxidoreductase
MQSSTFAAAGRLLLAILFIVSGLGKIAAPAATEGFIAAVGLPFPLLGYLIAVIVEVGVGAALLVGFQTRIAAGILAVFTLATALAFHADLADQNTFVHFMKNIAITGGLLQVVASGAASLSLDGLLRARRTRAVAAE